MNESGEINLSAEHVKQQEKLEQLFVLVKAISKKINSDITTNFIEFLKDNGLKHKDYFLSGLFIAVIRGDELPNKEDYKFIDTEDGKIESLIRDLAKVEPSK